MSGHRDDSPRNTANDEDRAREVEALQAGNGKPSVPDDILTKWQRIVDLIAEIVGVPAGLIMQVDPPQIEVFITSSTAGNPYEKGERADLNTGLYCETVMAERSQLLVPDALKDPDWDHNPDIELGMVSYLGFPLEWPDGEIFGTICILDNKENPYTPTYQELLAEFKEILDGDLKFLVNLTYLEHVEGALREARDELGIQVEEQTAELVKTNKQLSMEVTERKKAEKRLQQEAERIKHLLELYLQAPSLSDKELYDYVLDKAVSLTNSTIGFYHLVADDQETVILTTWNDEALKNCTALYNTHYSVEEAGNWVDCVRLKKPVVYNDFPNSPNRKGLPDGHAPINRFMSIPVVEGEKVRFIFGVGNKPEDYEEHDIDQIQLVANELHKIISQRNAEKVLNEREEQLRQSQKMEAIGMLAGGIAHDFNNLLTVIGGNLELALMTMDEENPLKEKLDTIQKASESAANLTRQLLTFSRKQVMELRLINPSDVLKNLEKMLRRLISEDIELKMRLRPDVGLVRADVGQIEQVLVNLAVNAREAMPAGGSLLITTERVILDEEHVNKHPLTRPGPHVMLSVSDTGFGMDKDTIEKVFEPFFTTKEEGTGLGLATVYGIVKQHEGSIDIYSEEALGTTFKIYLPVVEEATEASYIDEIETTMPRGHETILLVEDEEGVRDLTTGILGDLGYTVHSFSRAIEAEQFCRDHEGTIDLLLTDIIMPGISGPELAGNLKAQYPSTPVLFMSGYPGDAIRLHEILDEKADFLSKPFTPSNLARKVREVIDGLSMRNGYTS